MGNIIIALIGMFLIILNAILNLILVIITIPFIIIGECGKFLYDLFTQKNKHSPHEDLILRHTSFSAGSDLYETLEAYEKGDYVVAFREYQPLAEQGNARAQNNLGAMYYTGLGVLQDYSEAVKWYALAVEQGNVDAQTSLARMYISGEGVPQDYSEAFRLCSLAALQGHSRAQINLGVMYVEGHGVLQDYIRAYMWYNIAASNGNETAQENRDIIAKKMTPAQIEKSQDLEKNVLQAVSK